MRVKGNPSRARLEEGHDVEEADADVSAAQLDLQALN